MIRIRLWSTFGCGLLLGAAPCVAASNIDLSNAIVVVRPGELPSAEHTAAIVLVEEIEKRTHLRLAITSTWPLARTVIAITSNTNFPSWAHAVPIPRTTELRSEGYRLFVENRPHASPIVWIMGSDPRGALFGVGALLRKLDWSPEKLSILSSVDMSSSPEYAIRGHQLGYRPQANSYDTWSIAQYEQYIRELTFFGVNSIEAIPFPESPPNAYMKVPQRDMNRALGDICFRYGLDYWVWTPVPFDLNDAEKRSYELERDEQLFRDTKALAAVFIPSGDPGKNSPELLLKFAEDVSFRLLAAHPNAKIWLSLQGLKPGEADVIYAFTNQKSPPWLGGLVAGPSGRPIEEMRARLQKQYELRLYPDITHSKLAEFVVPQWDQAFALTEGRQSINPRPVEFAQIFHRYAPESDGLISYSDGAHDDVNKVVMSALSWKSNQKVRDILVEYAHIFFGPGVSQESADGILALENNWHGALMTNGAVEATRQDWQDLEQRYPQLASNWRWQLCLLRANFDAYIRDRLINETLLEEKADLVLERAPELGSEKAMADAGKLLDKATEQPVKVDLRMKIEGLCEELFRSIGLQTSVPKYGATNPQRGAVLDFIDLPLNNQWWLKDEFAKVKKYPSESEKVRRLVEIAKWEHPGDGSFYDAVGDLNKSPHVVRCQSNVSAPGILDCSNPTFWWWDNGKSRARLATQATMWPAAIAYDGLDSNATYTVRLGGVGSAILWMNGQAVAPLQSGAVSDEFRDYAVSANIVEGRRLVLTFERRSEEKDISSHDRSRLAEVWLLKSAGAR